MSTTTLLVVIGIGVLVKTSVFVGILARRERRQRRALAEVRAATAADAAEDAAAGPERLVWQLLWSEPGVLLVENLGTDGAAADVGLSATLETPRGSSGTLECRERFVGAGGLFEARFTELEAELSEAATAMLNGEDARADLECRLTWSVRWHADDGRERTVSRAGQRVLPVPDLALEGV